MLNALRSTEKPTVIHVIAFLRPHHEALIGEYANRYAVKMVVMNHVKASE